jgi:uncharacterized protein (TIGR00255 family)
MPYSMTGFAAAETVIAPFRLSWELRSVNHRFLDLGFRMPDELRRLEPDFREIAAGVLSRGKVDCTLKVGFVTGTAAATAVDPEVAAELRALQTRVRAEFPEAQALTTAEILRWPKLMREPHEDLAGLAGPAKASFADAVAALQRAREREGRRIADLLSLRGVAITALIGALRPLLDGAQERHRQKLTERLARLDVQAQPERLEQELALIAQRVDVSEEVDRIESHMAEIRDVLARDEPIGRRLDFLIQELNREANTLASKAQEEEHTRHAVELKVLIEQMREQVQNLE